MSSLINFISNYQSSKLEHVLVYFVTPHVQREWGKVIGLGVVVYIYMFVVKKKFESYFSDRLTFSNIRGRTSRRIYRLVLTMLSLEKFCPLTYHSQ